MSLSCLRSSDPNISNVDVLYDANSEEGHLYLGSGTAPLCSSTSPPPPSGCVVCFHRFVHAVCSDLLKNVTLAMEGAGRPIDLIKSECPGLLGDATNTNADSSGNHGGAWKWWLHILLILLLVIMIVSLVAFCKHRKCKRTSKNLKGGKSEPRARRVKSAVDSSEVKPVAEAAV